MQGQGPDRQTDRQRGIVRVVLPPQSGGQFGNGSGILCFYFYILVTIALASLFSLVIVHGELAASIFPAFLFCTFARHHVQGCHLLSCASVPTPPPHTHPSAL